MGVLGRSINRVRSSDESGQSTIEFALSLIFIMGFTMFYLKLSLVLAYGNFVQYASFMAARAYLSSGPDQADQVARAKDTIVQLLKKSEGQTGIERFPFAADAVRGAGNIEGVPGVLIGAGEFFGAGDPAKSWQQGVRYTFKGKLPFLLGNQQAAPRTSEGQPGLELKSESWLGREPSYVECEDDLGRMGIFDNGC